MPGGAPLRTLIRYSRIDARTRGRVIVGDGRLAGRAGAGMFLKRAAGTATS